MSGTDKEKLLALVTRLAEKEASESVAELDYDENYLASLRSSYKLFLNKHCFEKGQLVKWKKGLRNKLFPKQNQPAIVYDVLSEPFIQSEADTGSPYFRETLDIALALLGNESELLVFHYDSRRFEPCDAG